MSGVQEGVGNGSYFSTKIMCCVNEWFGSGRGISLWVEIFLLDISKESE